MKRSRVGKLLVFDMDGTLANLYGEENWLTDLRAYNPRPYINAQPLVDMALVVVLLNELRQYGYKVAITSWLSKETTKEYDRQVRQAKKDWLAQFNFPYDEIHLVKYGTSKRYPTNPMTRQGTPLSQILFDDNEEVLKDWSKWYTQGVNVTKVDLIDSLTELLVSVE